eukprot:7172129-Pyramimonas_sp.AAC.1
MACPGCRASVTAAPVPWTRGTLDDHGLGHSLLLPVRWHNVALRLSGDLRPPWSLTPLGCKARHLPPPTRGWCI